MADAAREELDYLLRTLRESEANYIAGEIETIIAKGVTREVEPGSIKGELTQVAFEPDEAYRIAASLLVASVEPVLMEHRIGSELFPGTEDGIALSWKRDVIENSPLVAEEPSDIELPQVNAQDLAAFEVDLSALIQLLGEEESGEH